MEGRELYRTILTPIAEKRLANNECPSCGKPKSQWTRRTDWTCCSVKCTETFWKEHDKSLSWQEQRFKALRRDNYTCQDCGDKYSTTYKGLSGIEIEDEMDGKLEVDHIKPVSIGGDGLDLDNLQTLCIKCHRKKTKSDMKVISKFRMIEKKQSKNQILELRNKLNL